MQSRIYRFQIVRAVVNGVFEAQDTDNNSAVTLYEWTPAIVDRDAAKLRLSEVQEQLHSETFSADASLYLCAASPQAAEEALDTLHSHNLFTGIQLHGPAAPPPLHEHPDDPPIVVTTEELKPPPPPQGSSSETTWGWVIGIVICSILAFAFGHSYGDSSAKSKSSQSGGNYSDYRSSVLQNQLDDLNNTVHLMRVKNSTKGKVHVAVMYKTWAGAWAISGWQVIDPGVEAVVASSPDSHFLYTAYDATGVWQGKDEKQIYSIPKSNFQYLLHIQAPPANSVRTNFRELPNGYVTLTDF